MQTYTVDRLEDAVWVVLEGEDGRTFSVPRGWVPLGVREGDVLELELVPHVGEDAANLRVRIASKERASRLRSAKDLRGSLRQGPKGEISL